MFRPNLKFIALSVPEIILTVFCLPLGYEERRCWANCLAVQLVFKIFNVCAPDLTTLQTDRQTDDMQSQYRDLHYSACVKV